MRVLAVCGSLQARSSNSALLRTARRVAPRGGGVVDAISVGDVPPFNPDLERDGPAPAAVVEWRRRMAEADGGALIATPETAGGWRCSAGPRPDGGALGRAALEQTLRAQGAEVVLSATVGVVAADKGAAELHDPAAVAAVIAALEALTPGRSG